MPSMFVSRFEWVASRWPFSRLPWSCPSLSLPSEVLIEACSVAGTLDLPMFVRIAPRFAPGSPTTSCEVRTCLSWVSPIADRRPTFRNPCSPSSSRCCVHSPDSRRNPFGLKGATLEIPFHPRGFSPPRRFAPQRGRRFVAPYSRSWGSWRFSRPDTHLRPVTGTV